MKILFAGSPSFALPSVQKIHEHPAHRVVAVLSNPDRSSGRGRKVHRGPVAEYAHSMGIPLLQPQRLDGAAREAVSAYKPDILAVAAYGKIFGPRFLSIFPRGGINLHPSLLPRYRGPSPIPAAILAGDTKSGISVQQLALEMDAGDIIVQEEFVINSDASAPDISVYSAERGAELMLGALEEIEAGTANARTQNEAEASYCRLIQREDARIDWGQPAAHIARAVRAYLPWPLAHSSWGDRALNILEAGLLQAPQKSEPGRVLGVDRKAGILVQTGEGILVIKRLQLQARKPMDWKDFVNGNRGIVSALLGGKTIS